MPGEVAIECRVDRNESHRTGQQAKARAHGAPELERLLKELERERGDQRAAREREQHARHPARCVPTRPNSRPDHEGARGSQSVQNRCEHAERGYPRGMLSRTWRHNAAPRASRLVRCAGRLCDRRAAAR